MLLLREHCLVHATRLGNQVMMMMVVVVVMRISRIRPPALLDRSAEQIVSACVVVVSVVSVVSATALAGQRREVDVGRERQDLTGRALILVVVVVMTAGDDGRRRRHRRPLLQSGLRRLGCHVRCIRPIAVVRALCRCRCGCGCGCVRALLDHHVAHCVRFLLLSGVVHGFGGGPIIINRRLAAVFVVAFVVVHLLLLLVLLLNVVVAAALVVVLTVRVGARDRGVV